MKRRCLFLGMGFALVLGGASHAGVLADLPMATGYSALDLCTRVMQSGDDWSRVRDRYTAPKVSPLPKVWSIEQSLGRRVEVNTWVPMPWFKRVAVFRPGLGCTVVPPGEADSVVTAQTLHGMAASAVPAYSEAPWPVGEGAAEFSRWTPAQQAGLQRWSDALFAETAAEPNARQNTLAVLVAQDGHLVYERYAPGYGPDQSLVGWSMTKSLTALWAGTLVGEGRFKLDDAVPVKAWTGTEKAGITWRHLFNMAPGLHWDEGHAGFSSTSDMLFSHGDHGAFASGQAVVAPPGTVFNYSTGTSAIASKALRTVLGGDAQVTYDHLHNRLFKPLGFRKAVVEPDASGTPIGGARGVLRPRDWLKLGELVRNEGRWNGQALIPAEFVRFMKTPSPAYRGYGGFMRLYDPQDLPAGTPPDVVYFKGLMGQYLVIVPSQRLMVLRMGVSFDKEETHRRVFDMVKALQPPVSGP